MMLALEAKYGKVLAAVLLLFATACIIAGTAIAWQACRLADVDDVITSLQVVRTNNTITLAASRSALQYGNIAFVFALLAAWAQWFAGRHDEKGACMCRCER